MLNRTEREARTGRAGSEAFAHCGICDAARTSLQGCCGRGIGLALLRCMMHAATSSPIPQVAEPPTDARSDVEAYYRDVAPFYDAELVDRDDLRFWEEIAAAQRGGRMLELGAGSGRVTAVLAPFAAAMVGIDLSPELLRLARRRLAAWPDVHLVRSDMRALAFRRPFDLIVAPNDPLSHLVDAADRDQTLQVVARHLAPSGRFVLDALWLSPEATSAMASAGGRVRRHTASLDGRRLWIEERWERPDGQGHCCHAQYAYRRAGSPPVLAEFDARDWSPAELSGRFRRAGLAITEVWGSYRRTPWDPQNSSQLIVEAVRA